MKRKRYGRELEAKVAIEAIQGLKAAHQIARRHQVRPNLVGLWKRLAMVSLPEASLPRNPAADTRYPAGWSTHPFRRPRRSRR